MPPKKTQEKVQKQSPKMSKQPPQKPKQLKEFNQPKPNYNKLPVNRSHSVLILLILIVVLAVIACLIVYFWQHNQIKQQDNLAQQTVDSLKSEVKSLQNQLNQSVENDQAENNNLVYRNDKYGFTFTFPSSWKDYISKKVESDFNRETLNTIAFGFADATEVLYINIYTPSQWQEQNQPDSIIPTILGENDAYIFALSGANDVHPYVDIMSEASQSIVDTFDTYDTAVSNSVWQDYVDNDLGYSYKCPNGWDLNSNKNYNGSVVVSECVMIYSGTIAFDDGVSVKFSFVPNEIFNNYKQAGEKWSEIQINEVKNEDNAELYSNNSFVGWLSMKNQKHSLNLIAHYQVDDGYYEVIADAMGDTKTDEEFKDIIDEIISTFKLK